MTEINTEMIANHKERWEETTTWLRKHNAGNPHIKRTEVEEEEIETRYALKAVQESELFREYLPLFQELEQMWDDSGLSKEELELRVRIGVDNNRKNGGTVAAYYGFQLAHHYRSFSISLVKQDAGDLNYRAVLRIACDPFDNSRTLRFGVTSADKIVEWSREQMCQMIAYVESSIREKQWITERDEGAAELERDLLKQGYNVKVSTNDRYYRSEYRDLRYVYLSLYNTDDLEIASMGVEWSESRVRQARINHVESFALGPFGGLDTVELRFRGVGQDVAKVLDGILALKY